MPARVYLSAHGSCGLVVLEGEIRWRHIAAALLGLYDRADTPPTVNVCWDVRAATALQLSPVNAERLRAFIARLHLRLPFGRSAIVLHSETGADIALTLAQSRLADHREYDVFYDLDEAFAFLGEPPLSPSEARILVVA